MEVLDLLLEHKRIPLVWAASPRCDEILNDDLAIGRVGANWVQNY